MLTKWAENYNVYIEAQDGFRENMSTVDHIFILHGMINHLLNKNNKLFTMFVYFTKAFDSIVRDMLGLGLGGKLFDIIKSIN